MQARYGMRGVLMAGALSFGVPAASASASVSASLPIPRLASAPTLASSPWDDRADDPTCSRLARREDRSTTWAAPLDRIVSVKLPDASLRDALDSVAAMAKVELSYSNELLPPGRRVCLTLERVAVGAVIESLLTGTTLRAIVIGTSQVVLAPSRPASQDLAVAPILRRASVLDRVVVTGTPDGAAQRGSPFALEVIEGTTLARHRSSTLGEALDLAVPGVWTWSATAGTLSARYGSIRGASSFGVSAPKVYLDGIEVANPLLVTQLDPSRVERVEVIRGPQGAALYGADAISGVVNILTRHDGSANGGLSVQLSSAAGVSATSYAPRDAFVQDHAVALRGGSGRRTFGLGLNVGTLGAYVPGASEQRVLADGDVRMIFSSAVLTGTARFSRQRANASTGSLFGDTGAALAGESRTTLSAQRSASPLDTMIFRRPRMDSIALRGDSATGQATTQYTVGGTLTAMPSLAWTHTLIAGVDGYRMQGLSTAGLPLPSVDAGALVDGQSGADRSTLRLRAVGRFDVAPRTMLSVTFAAEQALTRAMVDATGGTTTPGVNLGFGSRVPRLLSARAAETTTRWGNSAGLLTQMNLAWHDALFLVAGGRAERIEGFSTTPQHALLPMLGAAYVRDVRGAVIKLRSAYGTGIRPASSLQRDATWMGRPEYGASSLQPESQTGTEAGFDVVINRAFSVYVTRFDQRASGLIQPVASTANYATPNGALIRRMTYTLQNIGAITNRGWEVQGRSSIDRLSLSAAVSFVDSRVDRLSPSYLGDLRVGDRMLDVPARTYSLSASWAASRLALSTTLTRAEDWVGYDRVAVGTALNEGSRAADLQGSGLRQFWLDYNNITRVNASATYRLADRWSILLGGDNLLNVQRGAPDNATVTAGRTLTFGIRTGY